MTVSVSLVFFWFCLSFSLYFAVAVSLKGLGTEFADRFPQRSLRLQTGDPRPYRVESGSHCWARPLGFL